MSTLFQLIKQSPACTAVLGTNPVRFFEFGSAPQLQTAPYATFQLINGTPFNKLSGPAAADQITYQIDAWAKSASEIKALADAIREAIEDSGYIVFFNTGRDDESGLFRYTARFQSIHLR